MLKKRILSFVLSVVLCTAPLANVSASELEGAVIAENVVDEETEEEIPEGDIVESPSGEEMIEELAAEDVGGDTAEEPAEEEVQEESNVITDLNAEDVISYIYVESEKVVVGNAQNIALGMDDKTIVLENAELSYMLVETGETYTVSAANQIDSAALFTMNLSETGTYQLTAVTYGTEEKYKVDLSNQEYVFDVVAEEEEPAVSIYTSDGAGNVVETAGNDVENAVETALGEASSARPAVFSRARSNNLIIALDAGHDAKHAGAQGNGYSEEVVTLKLAQYVKAELEQYAGVTVYMTREAAACPYPDSANNIDDIKKRIDAAVAFGATTLVSFHLNSFTSSTATGAEVYYPMGGSKLATDGKNLAQEIQDELVALGLKDRGVKEQDYTINQYSLEKGITGVLIEHCYISNPSDVQYIKDDAAIKKLAQADAAGIISYFGLTEKKEPVSIKDGQYQIASAEADGYLLEVADASTADSANVQVGVSNLANNQKFNIEALSNGYYKITNVHSGKAVDVRFGYTTDGTNVHQYEWNESDAQMWQFLDAGSGLYYIKSKLGTYLTRSGNNVVSSSFTGDASQKWDVFDEVYARVDEGDYVIYSGISGGGVIDVRFAAATDGANVQQYESNGTAAQKWSIEYVGGQAYRFVNMNSGKVLDAADESGENGVNVQQSNWDGSDSQLWRFVDAGNGQYKIKSKTGTYLSVYGDSAANSANILCEDWEGTDGQVWTLAKLLLTGEEYLFTKIENGTYVIGSAMENDCVVSVLSDSKSENAKVVNNTAAGSMAQEWNITAVDESWYKLESKNSGLVLTTNGTSVYQSAWNGKNSQLWRFVETKDGYCYIASKAGNLLDVKWGNTNPGADIQMYALNGSNAQKWILVPAATGVEVESGIYTIQTLLAGGGVLDVANGSKSNSANVHEYEHTGAVSQNWDVQQVDGEWYKIINVNSNLSLDVKFSGTADGTNVHQYEWNGSDAQLWRFMDAGNGNYYIQSRLGKYLDIKFGYTANGTNVQMYSLNYSDAQTWKLLPAESKEYAEVEEGVYTIKNVLSDTMAVSVAGDSKANSANVQMEADAKGSYQMWNIEALEDGYYKITNVGSGKALDVRFGYTANGTNIYQYDWNASDAQCWRFVEAGNGSYYFQSKLGPVMDLANAACTASTNVYIYEMTEASSQKWNLSASLNSIMGDSKVTVAQMVKMFDTYVSTYGGSYNSALYTNGGAPTITDFCTILYDEAKAEGVKAEVLWAQVILETGWIQYKTSIVKPEQYNFGGIGASGNGNTGNTFPDVRTGLRAQAQHLKAYASTEPLNQECVDPRFHYVTRGCAPYVEWLGMQENPNGYGWAASAGYGSELITLMQSALSY